MVYIVPDMVNVITDTGQELPWFTTVLIAMTEFMANYWWLLLLLAGILVALTRWLLSQPAIRLRWDRLKFDMPLVQRVARSANAARYTNVVYLDTFRACRWSKPCILPAGWFQIIGCSAL